jgi:hypothetical protein
MYMDCLLPSVDSQCLHTCIRLVLAFQRVAHGCSRSLLLHLVFAGVTIDAKPRRPALAAHAALQLHLHLKNNFDSTKTSFRTRS